jgi:hypothetical protein
MAHRNRGALDSTVATTPHTMDTQTPTPILVSRELSPSIKNQIDEGGPTLTSDDERFDATKTEIDIEPSACEATREMSTDSMAEHSITYNGRHYAYGSYRYDALADAMRYSKLERALGRKAPELQSLAEHVETPTDEQRFVMTELGIASQDGMYRFGSFRYERLSDAIGYARLKRSSK